MGDRGRGLASFGQCCCARKGIIAKDAEESSGSSGESRAWFLNNEQAPCLGREGTNKEQGSESVHI